MDARGAPQDILPAHAADESTQLCGDGRPSWPLPPVLPPHEPAKPLSAPAADGVGLHELKGLGPSCPHHGEEHPEAPISRSALGPRGRPSQDGELMAEGHRRQREMHPLAQCRGQLLKEGLPKRLHDWPAWTCSAQKSSSFKADELLLTTAMQRA